MKQAKNPLGAVHVCGLSSIAAIIAGGNDWHLISCLADGAPQSTPDGVIEGRHLRLAMHDIDIAMQGYLEPKEQHVSDLIDFVTSWDRREPILIHCFAGISRSTAAALVAICSLNPEVPERLIAQQMRAVSPAATPNRRVIALGDAALGRDGRLIRAVAEIGPGQVELARPFSLPADMAIYLD